MPDDTPTPDVTAQDTPSSSVETTAPASPAPDASTPSSGPDSTSPSSGDSRQSDREGLLAAVKKVVETKPETTAVPSDDADTSGEEVSQDQAAAPGEGIPTPDASTTEPAKPEADPTEAELKKLRPETRRRFERLLAQRNEWRQSYEALQPDIERYRQLQGYLQQNQLAPADVNTLLGVGAALRRGDYQGFLDGVMPFVLASQEAVGLRSSPDLQNQVDQGIIDEATARELTRTRHRAARAEAQLNDANQTVAATQQVQHVDQIRNAVDTWEQSIARRDPDYPQLSGAVRRYAQGILQERGLPRTPQEAVALTQTAYDEVRAAFSRVQPAPQPTRSAPSSIHVATGTPNANPRNMKEAVVMALANMRRAS